MSVMETKSRDGLRQALGERVKRIRRRLGLTLQAAGAQTGLAASTLSKIENGQMSPTYENLVRIATGYHINIEELFAQGTPDIATARYAITRRGDGRPHSTPEYLYEMLCTSISQKRIIPIFATVKQHEFLGPETLGKHEGEEVVYVLSGKVAVHFEHYEPIVLDEGDCAYFDSTMGHSLISAGEADAKIFWVCTHIKQDEQENLSKD
ncbi:XRE family transcriptional regulator [Thalassospiraceae bacterium LMO-JJ14]|nr:XRE family transcriptional regulator [Thalassospiraceae bacterium LMO-JJ14]